MAAARELLPEFSWTPGTGHFILSNMLVVIAAFLTACGKAPEDPPDALQIGVAASAGEINWNTRTISFRSPGWTIAFCEGEGPFLCVARGDEPVGSVELLRVPVQQHTAISQVLDRGGTELEALQAAAAEFAAALAADRTIGFGAEYLLRSHPPTEVPVMGAPGLHLIVEGGVADRIQERIVHYYGIRADSLYLLTATGLAGGGLSGEFAISELKSFEPLFGDIAAVSRVSSSSPTP